MTIDESLLEIRNYTGDGYRPLVDYADWRVALLRYSEGLLPDRLDSMQRHDETDEVFVLMQGRCILFLGEGDERVAAVHAEDMQPFQLYNVKRGSWHTHTLSKDAIVLIVENRDTGPQNSPTVQLSVDQQNQIQTMTQRLWSGGAS